MFQKRLGGALIAAAMVATACSGSTPTKAPSQAASAAPTTGGATSAPSTAATAAPAATIGAGEGELNLVIWPGYAERGATAGFDWVTPFETKTGCKVNTTNMTDSNNGVSLMQSGQYDGISASGDATTRLIEGGTVAPVDTTMFTNYGNVFAGLKGLPHNTVDGVAYGIPHGRGPNLLMYNTETITAAPTSWDGVWENAAANKGKISIYDSSIYIADAALHLMVKQPALGITNPYQLNDVQFAAAVALLAKQRLEGDPLYWSVFTDQMQSYTAGDAVIGTSWQIQVNLLKAEKVKVEGVVPAEGSTGWSDTWMIAKNAKNPNCMLLWMDHMMSPEANGQATVYFGEAATSPQACAYAETIAPGHCDLTKATDEAYWSKIWYWSTPEADCADEDAATTCKTQDDWVAAWTTLRGS